VDTVIAFDGSRIVFKKANHNLIVDYNGDSGRIVRVISPYPNHQTMKGKPVVGVLTDLFQAGWKEQSRILWKEAYA
jgi:hypothetical protein